MMMMRSGRGHDDRVEVAENRAVAHLVVMASVQGRMERLHTSSVKGRGDSAYNKEDFFGETRKVRSVVI